MEPITITVNGKTHTTHAGTTLTALIAELSLAEVGCVFAINNCVVPRSEWDRHIVNQGDAIALFQAIAGG